MNIHLSNTKVKKKKLYPQKRALDGSWVLGSSSSGVSFELDFRNPNKMQIKKNRTCEKPFQLKGLPTAAGHEPLSG